MGLLTNIHSVLRRIFFNDRGFSEYSKPYKNLDKLIAGAKARKGEIPICPFCYAQNDIVKVEMQFRSSVLAGGDGAPLREDQIWKCPECRATQNFGLPLPREEWERAKRDRGGKYLSRPTFRKDERDKCEVRERLKELGYIDF